MWSEWPAGGRARLSGKITSLIDGAANPRNVFVYKKCVPAGPETLRSLENNTPVRRIMGNKVRESAEPGFVIEMLDSSGVPGGRVKGIQITMVAKG